MTELLAVHELKSHFSTRGKTVHAVDGVSLTLNEQEVLGIVGESGSGKSTLARTIIGLLDKTAGRVVWRGEDLPQRYRRKDFQRYASAMQMVFQDPLGSLNPRMTAREIVAEGARLLRFCPREQLYTEVDKYLGLVGLGAHVGDRYPHEFSGGQRQRLGIARALIMQPELLICDEPVSALDVSVQAQIINLLADLQREMGLSMLFIAHDLAMVRYLSDRTIVMYLGTVVEEGPSEQIFNEPLHPYTEMLLAASPEPDPGFERQRTALLLQGEMPSPLNIPSGCRFAARCPKVMSQCKQQEPQLLSQGEHRGVRCVLYV
ncbi:MAG: ABC transporter ATP-binding protein [Pseudomonadales bacterium]